VVDSTGASGMLALAFTAPELSGESDLIVSGTALVDGVIAVSDPTSTSIHIQYDDVAFVPIAGPGLNVLTASNMHGANNGYGSPAMAQALQNLATVFSQNVIQGTDDPNARVPDLVINAISLPWGGLFDYASQWNPPHVSHRFGNDADVSMRWLTDEEKIALAKALRLVELDTPMRGESPRAPVGGSCSTDDDCACLSNSGCNCAPLVTFPWQGCQSYKNYYCDGLVCVPNHWHVRLAFQ
jgi:hypothetical protein